MGDLILALDIGTTVAKAVVFDRTGQALKVARRPTPLSVPVTGWSEMDMEVLWSQVCDISREACAVYSDRIAVVSLSGISCGAWLVDRHGRPVRPAILWNDARAADTNQEWMSEGRISEIFSRCGSVIYPGFTLPLLHWLDTHERETLRSASIVLCCKDWLRFCMTGQFGTDESDASYMPFDVANRRYSRDILEFCKVSDYEKLLPQVSEAQKIAGGLTKHAAAAMGLRQGVPVAFGLTDVTAATVGGGAVHPGQALTTLGTSCLNSVVMSVPDYAPADVGVTTCTVLDRWTRTLLNSAGTMCVDWGLKTMLAGSGSALEKLEAEAERAGAGAGGVIFHPYLSGTGVVSPFVHPHAQSQFFGIRSHHERGHLLRSILEGVAFSIRDCYSALPTMPNEIRLVSGGSRNPLWCQIIADVLGVPVIIPEIDEASAWGAAMAGAVAIGWAGNIGEMTASLPIKRCYRPRTSEYDLYNGMFTLYRNLSESSFNAWSEHAKILKYMTDRKGASVG